MTGRTGRKVPWGGVVGAVICGFFGLIASVIVSVNLAINSGVPGGYEAGPPRCSSTARSLGSSMCWS